MSIKAKLSLSISIIVTIILVLNIAFSYISSKATQEAALEHEKQLIAKQLVLTIESIENTRNAMDAELGEKLRIAAIAAKQRLDADIRNVSNEQLVQLSEELDLDDITLWQLIDGEVKSVRSSNPDELGLSSKSWDYWDTAFHQLFALEPVNVGWGQTYPHYWTGPINYATSNPAQINKWGYYYDGSTNYMINTIINTDENFSYDLVNGTNDMIGKLKDQRETVLEITGFDPEYFGEEPIIKMKKGVPVYNLDVQAIPFGSYAFQNAKDAELIQYVLENGGMASGQFTANGKEVLRTFIPIHAGKPYVIGVVFDKKALEEPLRHQLLIQALISFGLILFTLATSYFIAEYMLRSLNQIMYKVNAIAAGQFETKISIRNKDELGMLAERVNSMGVNLLHYTTQLKDTARELRSTKQYLESFVNHTSDAIHLVDLDGRIQQVNSAFEAIYGWSADEIIGSRIDHVPKEHLSAHERHIATVIAGGSVTDYETVHYTKNGQLIDVSLTISPIRDEQENIIAIATITRNITSRKQTEEMIRRSEKLSVVGQLAAGVAHEIRNPLTTIRGFIQLQKQTGHLSPQHLDLVMLELDQINRIASEFLVFAKPEAPQTSLLDVGDLLRDMMMLMEMEARQSHVELTLHTLSDIPAVPGVRNQLKQVFVNVMKNGIEAMPEGGAVTIELDNDPSGGEVLIRFIDQGVGISQEDLARIGEPFFSRKQVGNGLGIMICQQIIGNHNGSMTISSELGNGTCVEVRLPVSKEDPAEQND
ncbi:PAS domain S-box protein [Paenibacillus nanensis]|uniref:PAS domain S-box protein n=1 Tax=Paenibacillus nanensis TaxID=393251 RepID=UPI001F0BAC6E|nr:PAS domain S-box protein [Paenibacillus nanensis]